VAEKRTVACTEPWITGAVLLNHLTRALLLAHLLSCDLIALSGSQPAELSCDCCALVLIELVSSHGAC